MKKRTTVDNGGRLGSRNGLGDPRRAERPPPGVVSMRLHTPRIETGIEVGIEVHEDELGVVSAQQLFRMRCQCGRSWFELELNRLAKCPACHRLGLVSQEPAESAKR
jgi:hypothetical protein